MQLFFTFLVAEGAKAGVIVTGVYIETRAEYSRNIPYTGSLSLEPSYNNNNNNK